jgi:hypothetical protein
MSLEYRLFSISNIVLDMCVSAHHALAFANSLTFCRDSASKHRLEVELKTVKGFLEIALEQLESENLEEE